MNGSPSPASRAATALIAGAALLCLTGLALVERSRSWLRRRRGGEPRLIWGPVPIVSLKYWSRAMRAAGYESLTCVTGAYAINERADFDVHRDEFEGDSRLARLLCDYRFFTWALRRGDVFIRFFDGGFLRWTDLRWCEAPLLRIAGKKLIVSPYGSDIAVAGHLGELEGPLFADYPSLREHSPVTERWVLHTSRWATLCICNWQFGFLPRWDAVWLTQLAIDTKEWEEADPPEGADDREVVVMHAPNHRHIKGTAHLERAIEELRTEGLRVRLELIERRPNEEIRLAMRDADIVGDQFLAGYALFAIEAMATGRPVLSNLDSIPDPARRTEGMRACPIVDTNPDRLRDDLRRLIEDPERRRELGRAGREFVLRHHSYQAVAAGWEAILAHVWRGEPLPEHMNGHPPGT